MLKLLVVGEIIQRQVGVTMVEQQVLPATQTALHEIMRGLERAFGHAVLARLIHGRGHQIPRVCGDATLREILGHDVEQVTQTLVVVLVNLVEAHERLQTTVLASRGGCRVSNLHAGLGPQDTGLARVHAITGQKSQIAFGAVVVDGVVNLASLLLSCSQADHERRFHRTAHRLALAIRIGLAKKRVGFPAFRPTSEPARAESLEHRYLGGETALVAAFRTCEEHLSEPAPPITVKRIAVDDELEVFGGVADTHALRVSAPDERERLNPPHRQTAQRTLPVLRCQLGNDVMHQSTARARSSKSLFGSSGIWKPTIPAAMSLACDSSIFSLRLASGVSPYWFMDWRISGARPS